MAHVFVHWLCGKYDPYVDEKCKSPHAAAVFKKDHPCCLSILLEHLVETQQVWQMCNDHKYETGKAEHIEGHIGSGRYVV